MVGVKSAWVGRSRGPAATGEAEMLFAVIGSGMAGRSSVWQGRVPHIRQTQEEEQAQC